MTTPRQQIVRPEEAIPFLSITGLGVVAFTLGFFGAWQGWGFSCPSIYHCTNNGRICGSCSYPQIWSLFELGIAFMLAGLTIAGVGFGWALRYRRIIGLKGYPLNRRFLFIVSLLTTFAVAVGAAMLLNYINGEGMNLFAYSDESKLFLLVFLYALMTIPLVTAAILLELACIRRKPSLVTDGLSG